MNINEVYVPEDIKYISDWKGYLLPSGHSIIDKDICGCGFTEFCIRQDNPENVILCSPRIVLLENKIKQHPGETNIFYFKTEFLKEKFREINKIRKSDLLNHNKEYMGYISGVIRSHYLTCSMSKVPCKILCTYDSFHTIKDILGESIKYFKVVVDEFQSIFLDAFFKSSVENSFFTSLQGIPNVSYVSATPMLSEYLAEIPGFNNIPYYKFVWPSSKVTKAKIYERWVSDVVKEALNIIDVYKNDRKILFRPSKNINGNKVISKEVVFYINSIQMIRTIITKAKLEPSECNIICADTKINRKAVRKIRSLQGTINSGNVFTIGTVPLKNEPRKMFTFCTRTTYLGADFYSDNAVTVVLSDANVQSLVLDIRLDLPQILGRQRLEINPWKNECYVFYKTLSDGKEITEEDFKRNVKKKQNSTWETLGLYINNMSPDSKEALEKSLFPEDHLMRHPGEPYAGCKNYYYSLDASGSLTYNPFLELSERRAWELTQKIYKESFTVLKSIEDTKNLEVLHYSKRSDVIVQKVIDQIKSFNHFEDRLKLYCEFREKFKDDPEVTQRAIIYYQGTDLENIYSYFGLAECRACGFKAIDLKRKLQDDMKSDPLRETIYQTFKLGNIYKLVDIKTELKSIYTRLGINKTPKASELLNYFNVKDRVVVDKASKKRFASYQLISIK